MLMLQFCKFADSVCRLLEAQGVWADYIDPCSGLPVRQGPFAKRTQRTVHIPCVFQEGRCIEVALWHFCNCSDVKSHQL